MKFQTMTMYLLFIGVSKSLTKWRSTLNQKKMRRKCYLEGTCVIVHNCQAIIKKSSIDWCLGMKFSKGGANKDEVELELLSLSIM